MARVPAPLTDIDQHGNVLKWRAARNLDLNYTYDYGGSVKSHTSTGPNGAGNVVYTRNDLGQVVSPDADLEAIRGDWKRAGKTMRNVLGQREPK